MTKGPWLVATVKGSPSVVIRDVEDNWLATVGDYDNARLMAEASALGKALQEALSHLHEHIEGCLWCGEDCIVVDGKAVEHDCWHAFAINTLRQAGLLDD